MNTRHLLLRSFLILSRASFAFKLKSNLCIEMLLFKYYIYNTIHRIYEYNKL